MKRQPYTPAPCPICGVWCEVMETRKRKDGTIARRIECANLHRRTEYTPPKHTEGDTC